MKPRNTASRFLLMLLAAALTLGAAEARKGDDDRAGDDRRGTRQERGRGADDPAMHQRNDDKGDLTREERAALCKTAQVIADPVLWARYECDDDRGVHGAGHARLNTPDLLARRGADDRPGDDHGGGHDDGPGHT